MADPYVDEGWELLQPFQLMESEVALEIGITESIPVAVLEKPPISAPRYLVAGEVRYTDSSGYLEMWNTFGDARYFSRTLGEVGPMAKLEGTADWRRFMLPFNAEPGMVPDLLEVNIVLPGGGTVALRDVSLYQTNASALTPQQAFWKSKKLPGLALVVFVIAVSAFLLRRYMHKKRAERELRTIAAADLPS